MHAGNTIEKGKVKTVKLLDDTCDHSLKARNFGFRAADLDKSLLVLSARAISQTEY
jgi:hypothetical protein